MVMSVQMIGHGRVRSRDEQESEFYVNHYRQQRRSDAERNGD